MLTILLPSGVVRSRTSVFLTKKWEFITTCQCPEVFAQLSTLLRVFDCIFSPFSLELVTLGSHRCTSAMTSFWPLWFIFTVWNLWCHPVPILFHTALQPGVTSGSPYKERLLQLYTFVTNLGNSYLIVRQLLSLGKQANISSGQGKFKWLLRDSTTRSIQSLRLFTSSDKTLYFMGYRKTTLQQSCSVVYRFVHEIRFQGNWKIWPHWPLLPLQLKESPAFGVAQPNYMI